MYFTTAVSVAILAFAPSVVLGRATGQNNNNNAAASTPAAAAAPAANMVQLGANGGLSFTPNMMVVTQGDNVTFAFMSAAHAVMSTSLTQPNIADNQVYSGIIPVDNTTPNPPGKKLPKRSLSIRGPRVLGHEEEKRDLLDLLNAAKGAAGNAAGGNNNGNGPITVANSGKAGAGPATFTVQMNTVGMQAFVCPAAQHAANGMIMMVLVNPAGTAPTKRATDVSVLPSPGIRFPRSLPIGRRRG